MRTNVPSFYLDPADETVLHASGVSKVDGKLNAISKKMTAMGLSAVVIDGTDLKIVRRSEGDSSFDEITI